MKVDVVKLRPLEVSAWQDLFQGLLRWELWSRLGYLEVKRRYRRTIIGPFWSAISLGIFVAAIGSLGVSLWKQDLGTYLPYLATGMLVWLMISTMVTESCNLFVGGSHLFRQMKFNYSILAYALVWRNLIVFMHNITIYVVIALIFMHDDILRPVVLLSIPGLLLVSINAVWIALVFGMVCLRFRDVQQLVMSVLQIAMLVTPIFWPESSLQGKTRFVFVTLNPLFHFIDIVRAPLIGHVPQFESYLITIAVTLVGWIATYVIFNQFRKRIAFWN
jgi:ABC-type polysaccharide/polyol phosphate export permease